MIYYAVVAILGLFSLIITFAIGFSKANKTEGDQYSKKTKTNMLNLTYLNIIFIESTGLERINTQLLSFL